MNTAEKLGSGVVAIIVIIIGLLGYRQMNKQWIDAGEVGIIYSAQGGVDKSHIYDPQAITVNYLQHLYKLPTKITFAKYSHNPADSSSGQEDGVQITTKDNASLYVDIAVPFEIQRENIFLAVDKMNIITIEQIESQYVKRAVKKCASAVASQYDIYALMGPKRTEANAALGKALADELAPYGITVLDAYYLRVYPSDALNAKITANVQSVTNIGIAEIDQKIQAKKNNIQVVQAQAQQESQKIIGASTNAKSLETLDLDNAEAAANAWRGHLSSVNGNHGSIIVNASDAIAAAGKGGK